MENANVHRRTEQEQEQDNMADGILVERTKQGDREAFGELTAQSGL